MTKQSIRFTAPKVKPVRREQLFMEITALGNLNSQQKYTIDNMQKAIDETRQDRDTYAQRAGELQTKLDGSRADFADLKQRLVAAELANERLRGYLDRVREDDTVREELVAIGDPQGEQQMVPKRRRAELPEADHFNTTVGERVPGFADQALTYRPRTKPRHWITY